MVSLNSDGFSPIASVIRQRKQSFLQNFKPIGRQLNLITEGNISKLGFKVLFGAGSQNSIFVAIHVKCATRDFSSPVDKMAAISQTTLSIAFC